MKLWLLCDPLWIAISLFVNTFNIGEPEESLSVEHKWVILWLSIKLILIKQHFWQINISKYNNTLGYYMGKKLAVKAFEFSANPQSPLLIILNNI